MKNYISNNKFVLVLLSLFSITFNAYAGDSLSPQNKTTLEKANIPVYAGLSYVNGITGDMVSMRFATSESVKTLREWYRKQLPTWALNNEYGSWILYDGKPGGGPANYMTKNQVMIMENTNLQQWFGLPADVTTEVLITIPGTN